MDPHQRSISDDRNGASGRTTARFLFTDPSRQGEVRAEIRRMLTEAEVDDEVVDDVLVVVSELSANATEHARADAVVIEVAAAGAVVSTVISYAAPSDAAPLPDEPTMPRPTALRGRGLAIVDALTESCRHSLDGGTFRTECIFRT